MKKFVAALFAVLSLTSFAQDTDLTLPGERWLAVYTTDVCADGNTRATEAPAHLSALNVVFTTLTTDQSLDNVLLKATFQDNGVECRYSALLLADNAENTISLVNSKAFSGAGAADCVAGKAVVDATLMKNTYKYLHGRAAIYVAAANAEMACGAGSETIGLHFQARGRIGN